MIRGQRAPRVRRHGVWVEVDENGNVVEDEFAAFEPEHTDYVPDNLDPEPETLAEEPASETPVEEVQDSEPEEAVEEEAPAVDFSKMTRAELNAYAIAKGLDPTEYRNRNLLTEALS